MLNRRWIVWRCVVVFERVNWRLLFVRARLTRSIFSLFMDGLARICGFELIENVFDNRTRPDSAGEALSVRRSAEERLKEGRLRQEAQAEEFVA